MRWRSCPADLDPDLLEQAEAYLVGEAAHFDPKRLRRLGRKVLEVVAPGRRRGAGTQAARGRGGPGPPHQQPDHAQARRRHHRHQHPGRRRGRRSAARPTSTPTPHRGGAISMAGRPTGSTRTPVSASRSRSCGHWPSARCWRRSRRSGFPGTAVRPRAWSSRSTTTRCASSWARPGWTPETRSPRPRRCGWRATHRSCRSSSTEPASRSTWAARRRLFTSAQRTAMTVRDGRCRTHGCTVSATWCEAHHRTPWSRGGRTDIEAGVLLCSWHHHRAHDPAYRTDTMANGDVRFRRRT